MSRRRPNLYTIPAYRSFADALIAGLIRRFGGDPIGLARGTVLLPNNRSRIAVSEAFVRASGGALLMPRLVAIGEAGLAEASVAALDPAGEADPVPPAIAPLARRMILARLVQEARRDAGRPIDAAEAVRLAGDLANTFDQLTVEGVDPRTVRALDLAPDVSQHWEASLELFDRIAHRWPVELARLGRIDEAARRVMLIARLAERWARVPADGFVCAAGITDAAPAVAKLLRCVAASPRGLVVFAGLATDMPADEWDALGPHAADPATGIAARPIATHPQFHLKRLLDRIGVARSEVRAWRDGSDHDAARARGVAIANALAPPEYTAKWTTLKADGRRFAGVSAAELATPGEEAQAIALALREAMETPERNAALVTPDRALARRVAAHCRRWGIEIDDTAGRPLSILPTGTLLIGLAEAAAEDWAPLALLTLLKHPLVRAGRERAGWLEGVRALDRALRGPRPAPGLPGITAHLADLTGRERRVRATAGAWWPSVLSKLEPIAVALARAETLAARVVALREGADSLCGEAVWAGPAGRAGAELLAALEVDAVDGPAEASVSGGGAAVLAPLLSTLMDDVAVRPPQGGHPRVAIYGLIEARLQTADLMILGGLNEGVWPATPAPDPWLAPPIRVALGLPGLETAIGVAAHDFGQALGAPEALMTRARRDARSATLASRLWLRMEAMAADRFERAHDLERWARVLDTPERFAPADRPAPVIPAEMRPKIISVTQVDRLKADPYAFYAAHVLNLAALDPVDAEPSPAWRGTQVHAVLEDWATQDGGDPAKLAPRALDLLREAHPLLRALWQPRLIAAIGWVAEESAKHRAAGRDILAVEGRGEAVIAGVTLSGRFDRIDALPDGGIAVIDYKTGAPPSTAAVRDGFSLQLGLLGAIAEGGGFAGVAGPARAFEYWSFAKKGDQFGHSHSPVEAEGKGNKIVTSDFVRMARDSFTHAANQWLTGDAPFTAKLVPEYAPYAEYDQLMRRDEWYGRDAD